MQRSQNSELAKRINQAFILLNKGMAHPQIVKSLAEMYGTSQVQAYRYLQQAKNNQQRIPIPENSVVFTVKLPPGVIKRIRAFAGSNGTSISKVVREALEDFLAIKAHGQRKETS